MKILALGDPHGTLPKYLDSIIKKNKIELIICVGDIPFSPEKHWLEESWKKYSRKFLDASYPKTINKICSYGLPVLLLRGNMWLGRKYRDKANKYFSKHKNLVNKLTGKHKIGDRTFLFFDVIFESRKRDRLKNKNRERKLNKMLKENKDAILICHNPPYGILDLNYAKEHAGSKIIRKAIDKNPPKIVLCGHIHESKGKKKHGKTIIYNLGSRGEHEILEV